MLGLIAGMEGFIIGGAGLPHFPEDFEPALAEAAEGAGMTLALVAIGSVVGLRPGAALAAEIGPLVDGAAQDQIAGVAQAMFADLPGLDGDGRFRQGVVPDGLDLAFPSSHPLKTLVDQTSLEPFLAVSPSTCSRAGSACVALPPPPKSRAKMRFGALLPPSSSASSACASDFAVSHAGPNPGAARCIRFSARA